MEAIISEHDHKQNQILDHGSQEGRHMRLHNSSDSDDYEERPQKRGHPSDGSS